MKDEADLEIDWEMEEFSDQIDLLLSEAAAKSVDSAVWLTVAAVVDVAEAVSEGRDLGE